MFKNQNDLESKKMKKMQENSLIKKNVDRVSYSIDGWSSIADSSK